MNVAVGLLPPRAGTVEVFGTDVSRFAPEQIAGAAAWRSSRKAAACSAASRCART